MADGNGDDPLARLNRLEKLAADHLVEHERIWSAIDKLRESQLEMTASVQSLVSAIRDLIDRIPPENLR